MAQPGTPSPSLTNAREAMHFNFPREWAALLGLVLVDALWLSGSWLILPSPWASLTFLLLLINAKLLYYGLLEADFDTIRPYFLRFKKHWACPFFMGAEFIALSFGAVRAFVILSYLACTLSYPLIDQSLNHLDQLLGFDWQHWFKWSLQRPVYIPLFIAYGSLSLQYVGLAVGFACFLRKNRIQELFWAMAMGLLLTIIVSAFLPALGPASLIHWSPADLPIIQAHFGKSMADVTTIQSHKNLDIIFHKTTGIITFPSFHTVCAIVFMVAFRRTGLLGYCMFFFNIAMLVAIPVLGNHYLADMAAGIIIALISLALAQFCLSRTGEGEKVRRSRQPRRSRS